MAYEAEKSVEIFKKADLFFRDALFNAMDHQNVHVSDLGVVYLVSILTRLMNDEKVFCILGRTGVKLADRYREAIETENKVERFNILRSVGDLSLVVAGVGWLSLTRSIVDVDYYADMGSISYKVASTMNLDREGVLSATLEELADKFKYLINVLTEATQQVSGIDTTRPSNLVILRMYEDCIRTGNKFFEEILRMQGVIVINQKTKVQ